MSRRVRLVCLCGASTRQPHDYFDEDELQPNWARKHNIAVWFIKNFARYRGRKVFACRVRHDIREALGLSTDPNHYDKGGDLAVHGNMLGGTVGLGLEWKRHNRHDERAGQRLIVINQSNLAACRQFLATPRLAEDEVY